MQEYIIYLDARVYQWETRKYRIATDISDPTYGSLVDIAIGFSNRGKVLDSETEKVHQTMDIDAIAPPEDAKYKGVTKIKEEDA